MKYKLLRLSLLSVFSLLLGGAALAEGDVTAKWDFQNINPSTLSGMSFQGKTGNVLSTVEGIELYVDATNGKFEQRSNGSSNDAQFNANTILYVPVKSVGDEVTVVSYPGYHNYTIAGTAAENDTETYKAKSADVANGYVEIKATGSSYLYRIEVFQKAPASDELLNLDNAEAKATFPFNLGTDGQKATYNNSNYFLNSKVTYGSNLSIYGKGSVGSQTQFQPEVQDEKADETNAIRFLIQPKFGLKFKPTKVSLKTTRYGTDGGKLDIAWQKADKTTKVLDTKVEPARNNKTPNVTDWSYSITDIEAEEGTVGLLINLYALGNTKQVGFADIVIEGTLTGQEKDMPVLASITINGTEFSADDVFEGAYEGMVKISKTVPMVSETNPLTATPAGGEVTGITYDGNETNCTVTISMKKGDESADYTLTVNQKPDYKLEYIGADGIKVLATQLVEEDAKIGAFEFDINEVESTKEGWKARGWFKKAELGEKYTVNDIITKDVKLYTIETEEEVASLSRTYEFNLKDKLFYEEDHEAFTPTGGAWHDTTHGWDFKTGNTIDLLVGPKATITITTCKYPEDGTTKIKASNGAEINAVNASDGTAATIEYEGTAGTLTLTIDGGQAYIHSIKIENNAESNYEANGQWIIVKAGDGNSFLDALSYANNTNKTATAKPLYIFLPNGIYDLGSRCNTTISGHNISIIGESTANTIIKNAPHYTIEGIGTTETLTNTGSGNYLQDLTLQNALDYYGAQDAGLAGGRAVCFWDKGSTKTIFKNVTMLSYQDTYYSNDNNGLYYFETSDIHGTVDFFCGGGTMFVENSTITLEKRKRDGSGGNTITAPATAAGKSYGYVFNNCTIKNLGAEYNYARAWQGEPRCAWLNTTLSDDKITAKRWTEEGMNVVAKEFVEYNTLDVDGNVISPESNVVKFVKDAAVNEMETILKEAEAAKFAIDKVFTNWKPADEAKQVDAPADAKYDNGTVTWTAVEGAIAYALFKNGEFLGITTETTYNVTVNPEEDELTIRAANSRGGFGKAAHVENTATGIDNLPTVTDMKNAPIYNLAGQRLQRLQKGINIVGGKKIIVK